MAADDPEMTLAEWGDMAGATARKMIDALMIPRMGNVGQFKYASKGVKGEVEVVVELTAGKSRGRWLQSGKKDTSTVTVRAKINDEVDFVEIKEKENG